MDFFAKDPALYTNLGIMLFMCLFFYFLIIRPQKKADQKRETFQTSLKKGDKVVTAGGIYGTVITLGEEKVSLQVADKVVVEFSRASILRFQDSAKQELFDKEADGKK